MEVLTRPWPVGDPGSNGMYSRGKSSLLDGLVEDAVEMEYRTPVKGLVSVDALLRAEDEYEVVAGDFLSLLSREKELVSSESTGDESGPFLEEEALVEVDDVHSPEYAKFRMEGMRESVDHVSNSPQQDADSDIFDWGNQHDVELAALLESAEVELQKAMQTLETRARAKLLEDEESKSLMQEWGLSDRAFTANRLRSSAVAMVPAPPPLGNGLGSVVHMRDGGSLRSMSPAHFQGSGSSLVMQVSSPVVLPSKMGATPVDILRGMAMAGMESLAAQAMVAMPLEDITGKPTDQIEHRRLGYGESNTLSLRENGTVSKRNPGDQEYTSLEDLAPTAMLKIEALALEGLRIQSEMSDQDAPCVVEVEDSCFKRSGHRMSGSVGEIVPLLDDASRCAQADGSVMTMAVSLDEWMRLDAGVCESTPEDQTHAIVAAHNQKSEKRGKEKRNHAGWMGDTVTLAMLVQLRDPLRSNEPVGAPMMTLVQAERVMVPPKPKLARRIPSRRSDEDDDDDEKPSPPRFKIVGVTVAGLTPHSAPSPSTAEVWGNKKQLQAGSRWLVAQGMQKAPKPHPALRGKAPLAPQVKVQRGESLWSISARVHGSGAKWRDLAKLNPHIRNPDIIFPNTTIRTR